MPRAPVERVIREIQKEQRKDKTTEKSAKIVTEKSLERLVMRRGHFPEFENGIFEEGEILKEHEWEPVLPEGMAHARVQNVREMMSAIYALYQRKEKPTEEEFTDLLNEHINKDAEVEHDFDWSLETKTNLWRVANRTENEGEITIKLQRVKSTDKKKILLEVVDLLQDKLTKEQIRQMLVVALSQNVDDDDTLLRLKKELSDKSKPQIVEARKGCWYISVNGIKACVLR